MSAHGQIEALREAVASNIVGQRDVVENLIIGLLADGNLLLEGLPGLAKTRAVKALAKNVQADYSRIQFTPDLLPSDVTGTVVYRAEAGDDAFRFEPGPLFANLVLVDEINRAPAKVQAALLEAMEERQVTVSGETHAMPDLFMVLATQNPVEQEGTYPLPEAQMDRFLMHVLVPYPEAESEIEIMRMVRGEQKHGGSAGKGEPLSQDVVFDARKEIRESVKISADVEQYIVDLVLATREGRGGDKLGKLIEIGASPRGTLALDKCARSRAWLEGRDYVTPDDVRTVAYPVLRHRLALSYEANADAMSANDVVDVLLEEVAIPG